jgi:hypothetical protein
MVESNVPQVQEAAPSTSTSIQHEEIRRLVYGANQEDCWLDRFNDSLDDFHRVLLEMRLNAMNGCLWW